MKPSMQENLLDLANSAEMVTETELNPLLRKAVHAGATVQMIHTSGQITNSQSELWFTVLEPSGVKTHKVKKAFSCLHCPHVGDKVLISGNERDGIYILAILERASDESVRVDLGAEVILKADNLHIETSRALSFTSEKIQIDTRDWRQQSQNYQLNTNAYQLKSVEISYTSETLTICSGKLDESYLNSQRFVAGADTLKALTFNHSAEAIARINAKTTFINGEELLRSDGKLMVVG